MDKYILTESWGRPNIQKREYIAQDDKERDAMLAKGGIATGDKVYVIESKKTYMLGFDNKWYDATTGGAAPALENVTVSYTENNTYSITPSANYDGIAQVDVTVNVPSDPSLEVIDVTYLENGNFTIRPTAGIDGISQANVQVNVPAPAAIVEPKTVTLYDYDGTIITQYGAQEFANLQNYPTAPVHAGLTFQSWNWPLATAKQYVTTYGKCDIGAIYRTTDNKSRVYIYVRPDSLVISVNCCVNGNGSISWGDGNTDSITGSSLEETISTSHTYDSYGYYTIELTSDNALRVGGYGTYEPVVWSDGTAEGTCDLCKVELGGNAVLGQDAFYSEDADSVLSSVVISEGTTELGSTFHNCISLKHVNLPNTVVSLDSAFTGCGLRSISLSPNCTSLGSYSFAETFMDTLVIPSSVTTMDSNVFSGSTLKRITIPSSVTSLDEYVLGGASALIDIELSEGITTMPTQFDSDFIQTISIPSSIDYISGNFLYSKIYLTSIYIASSGIGSAAFAYAPNLRIITFSNNVTYFEDQCFKEAYALRQITFEGNTPPTATSDTFEGLSVNCIIRVPQGTLSTYTSAENYPDPSVYTYEEYSV